MKHKYLSVLLAVLLLLSLVGCTAANAARQLDAAEDAVENRISAVEDAMEQALTPSPGKAPDQTAAETRLTAEQAQAIALEHAGFSADQVQYLRTEYEVDDRIPEYEVSFHEGRWEYEYEIHAETGEILSYSRDD